MNVAEFLDLLLLTERHEIVEASLPDMDTVALPQFALPRIPALAPQDAPCESLFEHLHDRGLRAAFRLGDQQVKVFRHDDVSDHNEVVAAANLFENLQEKGASFRSKKCAATVTAAGDEMKVSSIVAAV